MVVPSGMAKCPKKACLRGSMSSGRRRIIDGLHPPNAPNGTLVADEWIITFANALHPSKALSPMLVTDDGMSRLANELHPWKV